jgi:predicted HTH transcriptional regulator
MKKETRLSIQWFYDLLERGECDILDFKEQLNDKLSFGKSIRNFASNYEEMARDVVAFANLKGGFIFVGIVDNTKEISTEFELQDKKTFDLIKQVQDRTEPSITLKTHKINANFLGN